MNPGCVARCHPRTDGHAANSLWTRGVARAYIAVIFPRAGIG